MAIHISNNALRLSEKVVIYTNGNSTATKEVTDALFKLGLESKSRKNISVNGEKIAKFIKGLRGAEVEVVLEGGETKTEGFLVHKPVGKLNGSWVEQLGLETTEQGQIKTNFPFNETSVPGVFAVGDCGTMMQAITVAINMGGMAAAGLAAQLEAED